LVPLRLLQMKSQTLFRISQKKVWNKLRKSQSSPTENKFFPETPKKLHCADDSSAQWKKNHWRPKNVDCSDSQKNSYREKWNNRGREKFCIMTNSFFFYQVYILLINIFWVLTGKIIISEKWSHLNSFYYLWVQFRSKTWKRRCQESSALKQLYKTLACFIVFFS